MQFIGPQRCKFLVFFQKMGSKNRIRTGFSGNSILFYWHFHNKIHHIAQKPLTTFIFLLYGEATHCGLKCDTKRFCSTLRNTPTAGVEQTRLFFDTLYFFNSISKRFSTCYWNTEAQNTPILAFFRRFGVLAQNKHATGTTA